MRDLRGEQRAVLPPLRQPGQGRPTPQADIPAAVDRSAGLADGPAEGDAPTQPQVGAVTVKRTQTDRLPRATEAPGRDPRRRIERTQHRDRLA
jgi:hypothetical protein